MNLPGGRPLIVTEGILIEPTLEGRVVLWVSGEAVGQDRMWDRVAIPHRANVIIECGVCSVEVTSAEFRQRAPRWIGRWLGAGKRKGPERSLVLPTGEVVEPSGSRRADGRLAWAESAAVPLDERAVRARWPKCSEVRAIGPDTFLIGGIEGQSVVSVAGAEGTPAPAPLDEPPMAMAERALAEARRTGDQVREVDALTDLGAALLKDAQGPRASDVLREAVSAAKRLEDPARKADALTHLGMAMLVVRRPGRARMLFRPALTHSRKVGDRFAEKLVLEHLALAQIGIADAEAALVSFGQASALAKELGDGRQEAKVLWRASILMAEMGRRDSAIASAEAAVAVMRRDGDPAAEWYAHHLASFLGGQEPAALGGSPSLTFGGSFDAGSGTSSPSVSPGSPGPGLLRMALTAAKAMKTFVGSGFKTTPPEAHRARLAVCSACEHHTGVRCRLCGCLTVVKAKMLHERCPAGRWPS